MCDLDLGGRGLIDCCALRIFSYWYFCARLFKKIVSEGTKWRLENFTFKCDLDLEGRDLIVALCISSCNGDYFAKLFLKLFSGLKVTDRTQKYYELPKHGIRKHTFYI